MSTKTFVGIGVGLVAVWLVGAQVGSTARRAPADLLPAGALVVLEAKDLAALVSDWNAGPEKKAWVDGASYQSFLRSKLALKLEEVRKAYAEGAGVNADAKLLENLAGAESAVAMYDIGKLEALYVTRLPAARLADNLLTQAKAKFAVRNVAGQAYYVKAMAEGTAAFAVAGEWLIAGTREDLVAGALQLLQAQAGRISVRQERWYVEALAKVTAGPVPDARLVAHLARVAKTPHFRSYWIQQNITELSRFTASVSDLSLGQAAWSEKRVLLRAEPAAAVDSAAVAELSRLIPPDAGMFQVWAKPAEERVKELVQSVASPVAVAAVREPEAAPPVSSGVEAGSEDDLEVRVDVEEPAAAAVEAGGLTAIAKLAGGASEAAAVIRESRATADGVFVAVDSAAVVLGSAAWDEAAVRRAAEASTAYGGLAPVLTWVDGRVLVVANAAGLLERVKARRGAAVNAAYAAGYRHAAEGPRFGRMMGMMDFPQRGEGPRAPMLFSENLVGLGAGPMARLESVRVEANDDGAVVRQAVVYRRR